VVSDWGLARTTTKGEGARSLLATEGKEGGWVGGPKNQTEGSLFPFEVCSCGKENLGEISLETKKKNLEKRRESRDIATNQTRRNV